MREWGCIGHVQVIQVRMLYLVSGQTLPVVEVMWIYEDIYIYICGVSGQASTGRPKGLGFRV